MQQQAGPQQHQPIAISLGFEETKVDPGLNNTPQALVDAAHRSQQH